MVIKSEWELYQKEYMGICLIESLYLFNLWLKHIKNSCFSLLFTHLLLQEIAVLELRFHASLVVRIKLSLNFRFSKSRLNELIDRSKIVHGGDTDASEKYIEPTFLYNVTADDKIMQDEIFGK